MYGEVPYARARTNEFVSDLYTPRRLRAKCASASDCMGLVEVACNVVVVR